MQATLQHLFKKNNLQEIPVEALRQMTEEFPYFAVGQYLETRKLKELADPSFEDQFQKTLIYFHNPLWLQYKLSGKELAVETSIPETPLIETPVSVPEATGQLSHDLIEEVVLHQENDYPDTESIPSQPLVSLDPNASEVTNNPNEPEKQTIQREEPFTFQAYYTVDYFASQGIKLNLDNQQQDKLGKQLKSFTEWLKTMRRLPETSVVEIIDKIKEGEIAQIAAHSLEEKEVITEAMAEVLVKQGQLGKARDLYHKLSLHNPLKSTYFAAKIEDLKLN